MTPLGLAEAFKSKEHKSLYETGYYTIGGMFTGMAMVELWGKLGLPGSQEKITKSLITHEEIPNSNLSESKIFQLGIAAAVMLTEFLGVKGGLNSGLGMVMGMTIAESAKDGKYIGQS